MGLWQSFKTLARKSWYFLIFWNSACFTSRNIASVRDNSWFIFSMFCFSKTLGWHSITLTHFTLMVSFYTPKYIRKSMGFQCFQEDRKSLAAWNGIIAFSIRRKTLPTPVTIFWKNDFSTSKFNSFVPRFDLQCKSSDWFATIG